MDGWYAAFKFLHVGAAVIWIGGACVMVLLGIRADRAKNDAEIVAIVRQVAWAGERIFVPASIATLIFGLIVAWLGNLWANLWVILGLVGVATTIALGVGVLTPRAKKVEAGYAAAGGITSEVVAISREILTIAKFDMVLLFTVIADMVLKPGYGDWIVWVLMAIVIATAAVVWLGPLLRRGPV
ncbi:MAG TPA: DUF2269 family protein, partial [Alphaproteobacteria bacterium]|nr:DUF2269 family protein [Alphaproteobacteria bacterium]